MKNVLFLLLSVFFSLSLFANEIEQGGTGEVTLQISGVSGTISGVYVGKALGSNADYIESNTSGTFTKNGSTLTIKFNVTLTPNVPVGKLNVYFTVLITGSFGISNLPYSVSINVIESIGIKANFEADVTNAFTTIPVNFTDQSSGEITNWYWDFGDGNTSDEQNPSYLYAEAGTYSVSLIVEGEEGSDTITKEDYISVKIPEMPIANFNVDNNKIYTNETMAFDDLSTGDITDWSWDFGDGGTSTEQSPSHTYTDAGSYTVTLTVTGPAGSDILIKEDFVTVSYKPLKADFSADATNVNTTDTINFLDKSSGDITSWIWDFGDGSTSDEHNPRHQYNETGIYTVSLIVLGPAGSDTIVHKGYISVLQEPLTTNFSADKRSVYPKQVINFNDNSVGDITSWLWDFGDGSASNEQNPRHAYSFIGVYTISLTVTGRTRSETITKEHYISVIQPEEGTILWEFTAGNTRKIYTSPSLGKDGTIYVSASNFLYAINPDGTLKWEYDIGHSWSYNNSPSIGDDETIYVGGGNSYLYAINSDGTLKWKYKTEANIDYAPAIGNDGTIYIGSDQHLYAIYSDGTLKWKYKVLGPEIKSSPAISKNGTIYIYDSHQMLYAINSEGKINWYTGLSGWFKSFAIDDNGKVYIGTSSNKLYTISSDMIVELFFEADGIISSPVIGDDGTIYVGSSDRHMYAINSDGSLKWKYNTTETFSSASPAIADDGTIFIGSGTNLFAINSEGKLDWKIKTVAEYSSPIIANDGTVYIGGWQSSFKAIFTHKSGLANSPWPCFQRNQRNSGNVNQKDIYEPSAQFSSITLSGSIPLEIQFTNSSKGSITSWFWDFGDGKTSDEQNPTHTYTSGGTFTVSLTVKGEGGSDTETKTDYITGTDKTTQIEVRQNNSIIIYPNPTTGIIQIDGLPQNKITLVTIYNALGQKLKQLEVQKQNTIIDLSNFTKGIYYLNFNNNNNSSVKIIKE
jgi:large repetitive protein